LYPEQPVRIGEREYTFEGRREFAGIQVKRDPGANFIWVAAGLLLVGLAVTFYVPRLRMWGRVGPDGIVLAGLAEKSGSFRSEAAAIAEELGATVKRDTAEEGNDAG
jgi:cytochrome c biogenesis protein